MAKQLNNKAEISSNDDTDSIDFIENSNVSKPKDKLATKKFMRNQNKLKRVRVSGRQKARPSTNINIQTATEATTTKRPNTLPPLQGKRRRKRRRFPGRVSSRGRRQNFRTSTVADSTTTVTEPTQTTTVDTTTLIDDNIKTKSTKNKKSSKKLKVKGTSVSSSTSQRSSPHRRRSIASNADSGFQFGKKVRSLHGNGAKPNSGN